MIDENIIGNSNESNLLFESYMENRFSDFCQLIEDGYNINCLNNLGESLICVIIENFYSVKDNKKFFDKLMSMNVSLEQINGGYDPLTTSIIKQDDLYYMEKILNKTSNFNRIGIRNYLGTEEPYGPPIFEAVLTKNINKINLLSKYDVDFECCDPYDLPLLSFLLKKFPPGSKIAEELFLFFLEKGANVNDTDTRGAATIHYWAKYNGSEKIFDLLLENGACVNSRDFIGHTPILTTSLTFFKNVKHEIITTKKLIDNNANLNTQNYHGNTPAIISIMYGQYERTNLLFNSNCDLSLCNDDGNNVAHYLVYLLLYKTHFKNIDKFSDLLRKIPHLCDVKNYSGNTAWEIFKKNGKLKYLEFMESGNVKDKGR